MNKKYVISITRQFGSLGRPIARKMSELLGIEYYDRDIVEQISEHMNIPVNTLSDLEESYPNHPFFNMIFPLGFQTSDTQEKIYELQTKNINEYVDRESCIIVGRCSDFILRDHPNSIKIFIYAPYEERLKNCVESLNMKEDEAKKMIDEVDKARSNYHRHFAGTEPGDRKYIDVAIDSSLLGVDETANALTDLVKRKFCKS